MNEKFRTKSIYSHHSYRRNITQNKSTKKIQSMKNLEYIDSEISKYNKKKEENKAVLSRANLKIISILNNFIKEDINKNPFDQENKGEKPNSIVYLSKLKKPITQKKSNETEYQKIKEKINNRRNLLLIEKDNKDNKRVKKMSLPVSSLLEKIIPPKKLSYRKIHRKSDGRILNSKSKKVIENLIKSKRRISLMMPRRASYFSKRMSVKNQEIKRFSINARPSIIGNDENDIFGINEMEQLKINENIQNEVNYLQLRKKISKLKRKIKNRISQANLQKHKIDENNIDKDTNNKDKNFNKDINSDDIKNPNDNMNNNDNNYNNNIDNYEDINKSNDDEKEFNKNNNNKKESNKNIEDNKINNKSNKNLGVLALFSKNGQINSKRKYIKKITKSNFKIHKSRFDLIRKRFRRKALCNIEMKLCGNVNNRYRKLVRKKYLYDSFDDEEYEDEDINFYIPPSSIYIKIFDIIMFISSLVYFIYIPYLLSRNLFYSKYNKLLKIILMFIDIVYIVDLVINFFRAYQEFDERLIKKAKKIILHYLNSWFLVDLLQAVPFFTLFDFIENQSKNREYISGYNIISPKILIILMIKAIKVYKMINDNSTISYLTEILSENEMLDDYGSVITIIILSLCCLNMATCLFIFLGINSYPSWITNLNFQDEPFLKIYLASIYFIIVTITTVGYGDISGNSLSEIWFQLILLIIGTLAYSFIISYFSNYIIKINQKSMSFEKNFEILQEIKYNHPNLKDVVYKEVLRNIRNEQIYEKKDKHLLIDSLPYSLKNKLIMEMYKPIINCFVFFKNIENSDFIVKVATSLKPIISIKDDVLIQEGDYIKEIFFIKTGIIGLSISIDLNNPKEFVSKYLKENEIKKLCMPNIKPEIINPLTSSKLFDQDMEYFLNPRAEDSDSITESENNDNFEDIKIIEIRRNEHFGDALMFLNEPSPLFAKVKTKIAELLILKKMEAIEIYSIYPNIWNKINEKSLFNMEQIYRRIRKRVLKLSKKLNIEFKKNNSIKLQQRKKSIINNKSKEKISIKDLNQIKKDIKDKINKKDKKEKKEKKYKDINKNIRTKEKVKEKEVEINKLSEMLKTGIFKSLNKNKYDDKDKSSRKDNTSLILKSKSNFSKDKKRFIIKSDEDQVLKTTKEIENVSDNSSKLIDLSKISKSKSENKDNLNSFKNLEINEEIYDNDNFDINIQKHFDISAIPFNGKEQAKECELEKSLNSQNCNNFNILNNSNSSIFIKSGILRNSNCSKSERINNNKFINLTSTKENSLQLNSSYENINQISGGGYINNYSLQNKTKNFIINESNSKEPKNQIKKNAFKQIRKTNSIFKKYQSNFENSNLRYSKTNVKLFRDDISHHFKYRINKIKKRPTVASKSMNNEENNIESSILSRKEFSPYIRKTSTLKSLSCKKLDIYKRSNTKGGRRYTNKKTIQVNQKLNVISKNIQNANEVINNPNEFYMNLFNNILQKEENANDEEEKEQKVNKKRITKMKSNTGDMSKYLRIKINI